MADLVNLLEVRDPTVIAVGKRRNGRRATIADQTTRLRAYRVDIVSAPASAAVS